MFQQPNKTVDFDAIRLRVASPDVIRGWSYGEVTKAETINYRTQKPEKDGLFDEKIFGPEKDWECYCGKYKKIRYKGIVCDKCGVEVTHSSVRRERMGHLELASPVTHIWFLRGVPSRLGLLLDISAQNLEKVVYFANFIIIHVDEEGKKAAIEQLKEEYKQQKKQIEAKFKNQVNQLQTNAGISDKEKESKIIAMNKVRDDEYVELDVEFAKTESELKNLEIKQIISENQYQDLSLKFGHLFEAEIGGEALFTLLSRLDLGKLITVLAKELEDASGAKREKLHKRLQLMRNLNRNGIKPDHLLLSVIPVIPPDLRPMVPLDGGRFATSDLNDLYRRVINRNNRLKKLKELNAPEVIIRNEKRMLQEAVDALLDNSARATKTTTASTGQKRELKSLADLLKGKQGRFRQNLLGKRIDYSGRSVIVVGPHLKLHQCGLPKKMALELFRPFVISQLIKREYVHNIRSANKFIEANRPEIWDILEEIVVDAHVLLNRAPTLHRLGIQAFQPTLIEGKAIQLHPLVCTAFNADFDGDQMAVHVPLTEKAKEEAATLMLSSHNLLKPADGRPVSTPKMDVVWGLFYITDYNDVKEPKVFFDAKEAKQAWQMGRIHLRDKIIVKTLDQVPDKKMIETNVGRIFFNEVVPVGLPYYNQRIDSKFLADIVKYCLEKLGQDVTAKFLDDVKNLGFKYLTLSGYSWGMDDLPTLDKKPEVIAEGDAAIEAIQEQFAEGLLTRSERYAKIIETWTNIKDRIVQMTKDSLDVKGPVYSMITAGARGSWTQVVQMVGMKGLVTSPTGEIIELPVKGNFKTGFDVLEYYISTHGSRKGLSDTALRTANAGYLTRRLVDVAQDVVVSKPDCGDKEGQVYTKEESEIIGVKLLDRVWGRITLDDIIHPKTGLVVVKKGEHINEEHYRQLADADLNDVRVRSVLTCYMPKGVCQKCYGYDLGYNKPVGLGIAAGIVAAQSIGEPGTQLTMRTFHTGGVAGDDITQGLPRVEELFEARQPKKKAFMAEQAGQVSISDALMQIVDEAGVVTEVAAGGKAIRIKFDGVQEEVYKCKGATTFKVKDDETVKKGEVLFEDSTGEVVALHKGIAKVLKSSVKLIAEVEQETEYLIPAGVRIIVKNGDLVGLGDQLTEGSIELQQLFRVKGRDAVKRYIVKEIQYIYSSQGQRLNEKHIEVIIRQLFSRLLVKDAGDTNLLTGEVVERAEYEDENNRIEAAGGKLAVADDLFLGISKVALSTKSFLSAASFQETSKVLINAATTGKIDRLEGLKENVIIGRLIPAGTGFAASEEAKSRRLSGKNKE